MIFGRFRKGGACRRRKNFASGAKTSEKDAKLSESYSKSPIKRQEKMKGAKIVKQMAQYQQNMIKQ